MDACNHFMKYEDKIYSSPFIHKDSIELINFYRQKYEKNEFNLDDGYELVINFIKSFGIYF